MIKIHFYKTSGRVAAPLIRFFTFSKWNHVGITVNGNFYDTEYGHGVSKNRYIENSVKEEHVVIIKTDEDAEKRIEAFLNDQVGKKYDVSALIALPFRARWENPDKWFCSELVAAALKHSGVCYFPYESHRITPRDLFIGLNMNRFKKAELDVRRVI